MALRSLVTALVLDTSGFQRGIVTAGQAISNLRGQLRSLGSFAKLSKDIFFGGGAIGIIDAIGHRIADMIADSHRLWEEFNRGAKSGLEVVSEIAIKIPVLGAGFDIGNQLSQVIFGTEGSTRRNLDENRRKLTAEFAEEQRRMAADQEKAAQATMDKYLSFVNRRFDANRKFIADMESRVLTPLEVLDRGLLELQRGLELGLSAEFGERIRLNLMDTFLEATNAFDNFRRETTEAGEYWQRMGNSASKWLDDIMEPQERYNMMLAELNELLKIGYLTQEQFNRASAKAKEIFGQPSREHREGTFRQIHVSRDIGVGGLSIGGAGGQKVLDPQLVETNRLLKRIADQRTGVATYG